MIAKMSHFFLHIVIAKCSFMMIFFVNCDCRNACNGFDIMQITNARILLMNLFLFFSAYYDCKNSPHEFLFFSTNCNLKNVHKNFKLWLCKSSRWIQMQCMWWKLHTSQLVLLNFLLINHCYGYITKLKTWR
jgi:hypothetical protein